ncbi:MAG: 50S ribosomal protein P1 [Candidatus Nezhaarchaeota archaeon]|nr:50S ribosomal protein P1 [Candidatus Nezhaarchaeota archaeon]MCX8142103.1 50S ribosomal protein P1 [Candidatus Nezhaarchaeota archaeon]MDW8050116.1 50S ribosomal protein P1 [Nitrososphaerota archaeon]
MEYVYAALLLHHAGKKITEDAVKSILRAAGIEVDEVRIKALCAALREINIDEAIRGAVLPAISPAVAPQPTAAQTPAEKPKEEKKEEEKKEVASDETVAEGLSALFG